MANVYAVRGLECETKCKPYKFHLERKRRGAQKEIRVSVE